MHQARRYTAIVLFALAMRRRLHSPSGSSLGPHPSWPNRLGSSAIVWPVPWGDGGRPRGSWLHLVHAVVRRSSGNTSPRSRH